MILRVVMLGMRLRGFARMVLGMRMMGVREMRMMAGVLVFAIGMMDGGLAMVFGGLFVMVGGVFVMFGGASCGHERSPMRQGARKMRASPDSVEA